MQRARDPRDEAAAHSILDDCRVNKSASITASESVYVSPQTLADLRRIPVSSTAFPEILLVNGIDK